MPKEESLKDFISIEKRIELISRINNRLTMIEHKITSEISKQNPNEKTLLYLYESFNEMDDLYHELEFMFEDTDIDYPRAKKPNKETA